VSGVAALPRIVTLENATLSSLAASGPAARGGAPARRQDNEPLTIQATLQTYRYMDEAVGPAPASQGVQQRGAGRK
jgi:type IV pilus assembly protein PilO